MRFKFTYTKEASSFHFVSNLTEWHYACRRRDNNKWLIKTGALTPEEKKALETLRPILEKYNYGKNFLGIPFIRSVQNEVWANVCKWVGRKDCQKLHTIFDIFTHRFTKIWSEEKPKLKKWQERLENLTSTVKSGNLAKDLENFFNTSTKSQKVHVFLLINAVAEGVGGNANAGEKAITLDCSSTDPKIANQVLAILWHETIHLFFEKEHLMPLLTDYLKRHGHFILNSYVGKLLGRPTPVLKEAIIGALTPNGVIAKKYFGLNVERINREQLGDKYNNIKKNPKNFRLWYHFAALELAPLIEEYLTEKKVVDLTFLEETLVVYKRYLALIDTLSSSRYT